MRSHRISLENKLQLLYNKRG